MQPASAKLPIDRTQLKPGRWAPIENLQRCNRVRRAKEIVLASVWRERLQNRSGAVLIRRVTGEHAEPIEHACGLAVEVERYERILTNHAIAEKSYCVVPH